jgi:hypothetical protein
MEGITMEFSGKGVPLVAIAQREASRNRTGTTVLQSLLPATYMAYYPAQHQRSHRQ